MKILHTGDIHVCEKHMKWVDRALTSLVKYAQTTGIDAWVIAGDTFDSAIPVHSPAYEMLVKHVVALSNVAPGIILYGTPSHDRPGSLDPFKHMPTRFPIYVADKPVQVALTHDRNGVSWNEIGGTGDVMLFSCLPSLNKADPRVQELGARDYVREIFEPWSKMNMEARGNGLPTALVTHGTVTGCRTESDFAMVSPDHEFDEQTLFDVGADVVMINHIHAHQEWSQGDQIIAYPGSLARLVHGDHAPKGFLAWDIDLLRTEFTFIESPTRKLLEIEFDGPPDMEELARLADEQAGDSTDVRIRWSIDQEHAHSIDRKAIQSLFAGAESLKLEGTINAVQSVRAAGISKAMTLAEKLGYFATTTGDEDRLDELTDRLGMLQSMDVERIAAQIIDARTVEATL